jgi:anti-sigma factor RsiW
MMRTTCEELTDRIVDYVDGELPADEAEIVARHLSECPRCRHTANDLERSLGLARIIWQDNLADTAAAGNGAVRGSCRGHLGRAVSKASRLRSAGGTPATRFLCPPRHTTNLRHGSLYAVAVAAGILLVVGVLVRPVLRQSPRDEPLAAKEVEGRVARAGLAAELLAATQMLARCEGTESIVERQYEYILRHYADTPAAKAIRADLGSGGM